MFSSINNNLRKSYTLLKSAYKDQEKEFLQEEIRLLDFEKRFNEEAFDPVALKKIEINNLKKTNPFDYKV